MTRFRRGAGQMTLVLAVAATFTILLPAPAFAAVTCSRGAAGILTVQTSGASDRVAISRVGDELRVTDEATGTTITCAGGTPTVTNTSHIQVFDNEPTAATSVRLLGPETFEPGAGDEPGTNDEIEISIGLGGDDGFDTVYFDCATTCGYTAGTLGVNFNVRAEAPDAHDSDVSLSGVDRLELLGGDSDDDLHARGFQGTGEASTVPFISLDGRPGEDWLTGGTMFNDLRGGPGDDEIWGLGAFDSLHTSSAPAGVTVNLSTLTATGEGTDRITSIERVFGTGYGDVIIGDSENNDIFAGAGHDLVDGRGGDDYLRGHEGVDTVSFRTAGVGVRVDLAEEEATIGAGPEIRIIEIERVVGSRYADLLLGDLLPNRLLGIGGADDIRGRRGRDVLNGGLGEDVLAGLGGNDALYGGAAIDLLSGGNGSDLCRGGGGRDVLRSCER